jgi:hypothetical protein
VASFLFAMFGVTRLWKWLLESGLTDFKMYTNLHFKLVVTEILTYRLIQTLRRAQISSTSRRKPEVTHTSMKCVFPDDGHILRPKHVGAVNK